MPVQNAAPVDYAKHTRYNVPNVVIADDGAIMPSSRLPAYSIPLAQSSVYFNGTLRNTNAYTSPTNHGAVMHAPVAAFAPTLSPPRPAAKTSSMVQTFALPTASSQEKQRARLGSLSPSRDFYTGKRVLSPNSAGQMPTMSTIHVGQAVTSPRTLQPATNAFPVSAPAAPENAAPSLVEEEQRRLLLLLRNVLVASLSQAPAPAAMDEFAALIEDAVNKGRAFKEHVPSPHQKSSGPSYKTEESISIPQLEKIVEVAKAEPVTVPQPQSDAADTSSRRASLPKPVESETVQAKPATEIPSSTRAGRANLSLQLLEPETSTAESVPAAFPVPALVSKPASSVNTDTLKAEQNPIDAEADAAKAALTMQAALMTRKSNSYAAAHEFSRSLYISQLSPKTQGSAQATKVAHGNADTQRSVSPIQSFQTARASRESDATSNAQQTLGGILRNLPGLDVTLSAEQTKELLQFISRLPQSQS
jgi:hypothetical protein